MDEIYEMIARRLGLPRKGVEAVVTLLDEGGTVPFISRYRKERTGSLDEVQVRNIETELKSVRELLARKEFVRNAIESAGAMTPKIDSALHQAQTMTEVEDIYAPFKPKRRTRATVAREKGLEPLARIIMSGKTTDCRQSASRFAGKNGVETVDEAIEGAADIIAEWASESVRLRNMTRNMMQRSSQLVCRPVKGKEKELADSPYAVYGDFSRLTRHVPSHQYLALRRAEREGLLKVKYDLDESSATLGDVLSRAFVPHGASGACRDVIGKAVEDAAKRLLRPSVENEISASIKDEADRVAIEIFAGNLRQLLLAAPLKGKRVLAVDPGYRTGCKTVALDDQGNLLGEDVIYPTAPKNDTAGATRTLERMLHRYKPEVVALGNGTASRETERFLKGCGLFDKNKVFVVSENGASVYSASEEGRREFPDKDVTVRGAVSIGRRLIDPLAELVKIDPKSIGVGQYQHDVDQSKLKDALDYVVMSCVNAVGVDVNTASERLLSYVSGIGRTLAANIVAYRAANGNFRNRRELRKVARLGEKAYEQAAGFLRIAGGDEPLDNTGIHPESYGIVREMARSVGTTTADLPANATVLDRIDVEALASRGVGGRETMADIVAELRKPGRDPRLDDNSADFTPEAESFDMLSVGMELPGVVNNITAFGAFIDLGIKENGLLHISKLGRRVNSVSDILRLGQQIRVRVIDIDTARKRISLELILG